VAVLPAAPRTRTRLRRSHEYIPPHRGPRAAQESREHKRREDDFHTQEVLRYYGEQRNLDAASNNALKDDLRRREREARERAAEQNILDSVYRVRAEGLGVEGW